MFKPLRKRRFNLMIWKSNSIWFIQTTIRCCSCLRTSTKVRFKLAALYLLHNVYVCFFMDVCLFNNLTPLLTFSHMLEYRASIEIVRKFHFEFLIPGFGGTLNYKVGCLENVFIQNGWKVTWNPPPHPNLNFFYCKCVGTVMTKHFGDRGQFCLVMEV